MCTNASTEVESTDTELSRRDARALTECMTVLEDTGTAAGAPGLFQVVGENGSTYTVDVVTSACSCPDAEHRNPAGGCKHVRRVAFATGERTIPAWVAPEDVDEHLGEHIDGGPTFAGGTSPEECVAGQTPAVATDGGIIEAGDDGEILGENSDDSPTYTYHHEPPEQGGARYVRCESCGAECIPADPDRLYHRENCPHGER